MKNILLAFFCVILISNLSGSDPDRWQQRISYKMEVDFDVTNHQYTGTQEIKYTNNSKDHLDKVFFHLFFNAFQPGSMMDVRSRTIADPDGRVADRISILRGSEIGYMHVKKLKCEGKKLKYEEVGTILEVEMNDAIKPGQTVTFEVEFEGQVPLQIRRSGRDNAEGISYSMAQWYPKMAEYDRQGWHANPYVGREFYGVWGDFDVKINMDSRYTIGGTGYLQNPDEIGKGYTDQPVATQRSGMLQWHFKAPEVHDFMWAADPDYKHDRLKRADGTMLHFYYKPGEKTTENWEKLPAILDEAFNFINQHYGQYPYKQYSFIQGGDGGMEYPMGTLITGHRSLGSLVGVSVHELLHSWYQMVLGTNESLFAWMDEGFTSYASAMTMNYLKEKGLLDGTISDFPQGGSYRGYYNLAQSGSEEPLTTHADHFNLNGAYGLAAYSKGAVFLSQIEYIIGEEAFKKGLITYFNTWKFKHPDVNDFLRVMEKESGLELDWYKEYFVYTTKTIDYAIDTVVEGGRDGVRVSLSRQGYMPMPLDVVVTDKKGKEVTYYIPLQIMRGEKEMKGLKKKEWKVQEDWPWTNPTYLLLINEKMEDIESIKIDPSGRMADINQMNNVFPRVVEEDSRS